MATLVPALAGVLAICAAPAVAQVEFGFAAGTPETATSPMTDGFIQFDLGEGKGRAITQTVRGGVVGFLVDARGRRPFELPSDPAARIERLRAWNGALGLYPEGV